MSAHVEIKATIYNKNGKVLSTGYNSYVKTHPKMKQLATQCSLPHKEFLHAEIAAIIKCKKGKPYKIKIERYGKDGRPLNAKPCPICEAAIKMAGIKFVEYTI